MKAVNLKALSVDELLTLRDRINDMLAGRVDQERRDLQARLKRLDRFATNGAEKAPGRGPGRKSTRSAAKKTVGRPAKKAAKKAAAGKGRRAKVAPKFRNPSDPSQTWAGRGLQPKWLSDAIKSGGRLDDFRIAGH